MSSDGVRVNSCFRTAHTNLRNLMICCCLLMALIIYTWQGFEFRKRTTIQISDMSLSSQAFLTTATAIGNEAEETITTKLALTIKTTKTITHKPNNSKCSGMPRTAMTAVMNGRLGNQLFSYATLYAFAKRNNRTAYLNHNMSSKLSPYFKVSMKKMSKEQHDCVKWVPRSIPQINECIRTQLSFNFPPYVLFIRYQGSYKCFEDYWPEIKKEFQFNDKLVKESKEKIKKIVKEMVKQGQSATVVGVHVRRTDYLKKAEDRKFEVPTAKYYHAAMKYFQKKYKNVIFIISSDDTLWCESNFNRKQFKIKFLHENGANSSAVEDLAVLVHCDHLIFGLGSFGHWAGFLNRGQVVFCSDCYTQQSPLLKEMGDYANLFLPNWIGFTVQGKQNSTLAKWDKSKSKMFTIKEDLKLLREVASTKSLFGNHVSWQKIKKKLKWTLNPTQIKERFEVLLGDYHTNENRLRSSGTDDEVWEKEQLLTQIVDSDLKSQKIVIAKAKKLKKPDEKLKSDSRGREEEQKEAESDKNVDAKRLTVLEKALNKQNTIMMELLKKLTKN